MPHIPLRHRALVAFVAALTVALCACGATPGDRPPPWAAAHPDPSGMHFADAQGLCSITVRYPNDAPGEIDFAGQSYLQRDRRDSRSAAGTVVGRAADWTVYRTSGSTLVLVTATASFDYRSGSKCGSNSAVPT